MCMAWSLAQGATFSALGENLFSITVNCLGDWKRITEDGPWLFRDHGVLIEPYDGLTKFYEVALDKLAVWIQIVDLPPMYRKELVVRSLTRKVGEVSSVMLNPRLILTLILNSTDPTHTYDVIHTVYTTTVCIRNNTLSNNTFLEHGNGKHDKDSMVWGDWILAPRSGGQSQGPRQNTTAGSKPNPQGRAESGRPSVKELQDDASSPHKAGDGHKYEGEKSRKRLTYEEPATEPSSSKLPLLLEAAVVGIIPMEELGPNPAADGEEEDDVSSQDSK
ncbi:hypothetical protein D1007_01135 [Hordeum vulgare]|nr:hypothetical protein D1007_01135 [Hordeum vulgare]